MEEENVLEKAEKVLIRKRLIEEYSKATACVRDTFTELSQTTMSGQDYIKTFSGLIVVLGQTADRMIYFLGKVAEEIPVPHFDQELKRMEELNRILSMAKSKLKG